MHWTEYHSHWFAKNLIQDWGHQDSIQLLKNPDVLVKEICQILSQDLSQEKNLDQEVTQMLNDLEKSHGSSFDRQKMRSMLKKKLAEKKGIIL